MQPASSSVGGGVHARIDSLTDFHLQQKIEYKSGFNGNDNSNSNKQSTYVYISHNSLPNLVSRQKKIEYKSAFIGNDYKKVVYLGKEVYDTQACSLI